MAIDLLPYSGRNSGIITDAEHEMLWGAFGDGVLPGQSSNALRVSVSGGNYTVQPGRALINGHVFVNDEVVAGPIPSAAGASRYVLVTAYYNRLSNPWDKGIRLVLGTAGGGRPSIDRTVNGRYEFLLGGFIVPPAGSGATLLPDTPVVLDPASLAKMPNPVEVSNDTNESYSGGTTWATGTQLCSTTFIAPPSGRVAVHTYANMFATAGSGVNLAFIIRVGDSMSGPIFRNAFTRDGPTVRGATEFGLGAVRQVTGLTPGQQYFIYTVHSGSAAGQTVQVRYRRLFVEPLC